MSVAITDRRIRSLRPPKPYVDPYTAHGSLIEEERRPNGVRERALTIFLAGAECPFTCTFCDLWRWTIDGPTPPGALVRQVEQTLERCEQPLPSRLKLYNASNFFDRRAVPVEDRATLAALARPFSAVTVESHVSTIGNDTLDFAGQIDGRLEVAVGLETIHPEAMSRLNKRLELSRFDAAAEFLRQHAIDLRVFVLLGAPYVPAHETVLWTVRTVEYAVERGASVVAIIPVRGGNGEMERLQALGHFVPPTLRQLEDALDASLGSGSSVVTADLWDLARLSTCAICRVARTERLVRVNRTGHAEPRVRCRQCGAE
ncbi:MAG: radical SAM protein [Gemmatimonadaceae bacterium]